KRNESSYLWLASGSEPGRAKRVTTESEEYAELCWTSDGRILFDSSAGETLAIWSIKSDGSHKRQLIANGFLPSVPTSGGYIYYSSDPEPGQASHSLWRIDNDGGNPTQLLNGIEATHCSADGKW